MKNRHRSRRLAWALSVLAFLLAAGCAQQEPKETVQPSERKTAPAAVAEVWPEKEWQTDAPERHGVDPDKLKGIVAGLADTKIEAMVAVKDGYIIGEYYKDGDPTRLYEINSITKSITSALVGIAIDRGLIGSVDDPVLNYFPELAAKEQDADKKSITLAHLLSMTSGLDWPEWSAWNSFFEPMLQAPDWSTFVLERPMEYEPGMFWNYNTGGSQVLATILRRVTGTSEREFAEKSLFGPIGIQRVGRWYDSPDGSNSGGFGLQLTPRDLARFGLLYLHGGAWNGTRIVSEKWVAESTGVHAGGHFQFGEYGYHWWVGEYGGVRVYNGMGYAGQYLFVVPELNMVVVFNADSPEDATLPQRPFAQLMRAVER